MLKIRTILTSMLLLLLVGVGINVRAAVAASNGVQKTTDQGQESDKESENKETKLVLTELDFFDAFSLVNIQLQWRDLHLEADQELTELESAETNEHSSEKIELVSLDRENTLLPVSLPIKSNYAIVLAGECPITKCETHFIHHLNLQKASTIAYILNCGTYPSSC